MPRFALHLRYRVCLLFFAFFLCVTSIPLLVSRSTAAAELAPRDKGSPFGVVAALGNRVRSDEIDEAVALMREAGVQWQREEIFWDVVQPERGGGFRWNGDGSGFYDYDRAISAQANGGINVLGLLDYNPAWFKGQNPRPEEWIDDWGNYVYATVARYGRDRGQIKYWELWNESNLAKSGYESGLYTVADFVRILEVGRAAAKAADPDAQIVMGGLASIWSEPPSPFHYDYFEYLEQVGELGGWNYVDVIAIHPYRPDAPEGDTWRRTQSLDVRQELERLDNILLKYGSKPIWLTEMGWSTVQNWPGVDPDTQAFFLARFYVLAIAHPSIEKIFWYDFRDDTQPGAPYNRPVYNNQEVEFHYGLLNRTYPLDGDRADLRKPSFLAYRTLTQMLGGLTLQEVLRDGRQVDQPGVYWYRFGGVGRRVDVLWRTGGASERLAVQCDCREAIVRGWNGTVKYVLYTGDGTLDLHLESLGAPMYVEYDPPVPDGGVRFEETGHSLRGGFKRFWDANGGVDRFGLPLTEELIEPQAGSGRPRVVQYFERTRFEHFPEYSGTPFEVQVGRLGDESLVEQGVDWQTLPRNGDVPPDCRFFPETGKRVCPPFLAAWERAGGMRLVGLPLTDAFPTPREGGPDHTVQYFERARLEYFPENVGTPHEVQLGLLGRELLTRWGTMP